MKIEIRGLVDNAHASAAKFAVKPVTFAEHGANSNDAGMKILRKNTCLLTVNHWVNRFTKTKGYLFFDSRSTDGGWLKTGLYTLNSTPPGVRRG